EGDAQAGEGGLGRGAGDAFAVAAARRRHAGDGRAVVVLTAGGQRVAVVVAEVVAVDGGVVGGQVRVRVLEAVVNDADGHAQAGDPAVPDGHDVDIRPAAVADLVVQVPLAGKAHRTVEGVVGI